MKATTTITLAITLLTLLGIMPQAEARHPVQNRIYVQGYSSCAPRVYTERYFIGYDHCGNPLWGTRTVRPVQPRVVYPRYNAPCPQPYYPQHPQYSNHCQSPYNGSGISVRTTYRRY